MTVMFKSILCFFKRNKKNTSSKVTHTLFKEQFKYFKTTHAYHFVDPSPWPLVASLGAFMFTVGLYHIQNLLVVGIYL
jgi:hypothetical protein